MPSRNIIVFFLSGVCVFLGGGNCVRKSDFYFSQLPPLKPLSQKKAEQFDDQPCADFSQIEPFTVAITSVLPRLVKSGGTLYLNAKANPVFGFVTYLWKIQGNKSGVTDSEGNCQLQIPEINGCDDQLTISVIATDEKGRTAEAQAHIMVSKTWCTYQFKEDQLLSNGITKLALSDDGAIWVGTVEGLNRFDGDKWNAITAANSVLGHSPNFPEGRNYINALFVHKNKSTNEDEVWVGACESENYNCAGAQRFIWKTQEKKTADWTRYSKENGNLANPYQNLHSNVIQVIASDKGKIFLGTDNGIDVIDPDKPEQKSSYLIRGYGVNAILLENEEEWYGTRASYLSVGSIFWLSRKK